jgi:hypothetical protein
VVVNLFFTHRSENKGLSAAFRDWFEINSLEDFDLFKN